MHTRIDLCSELKIKIFAFRFVVYELLQAYEQLRYNFCCFGLEMRTLCFNGMRGRIRSIKQEIYFDGTSAG